MSPRIPLREQTLAFRELATMIGAGVTLVEALASLEAHTMHADFRRFLQAARVRVGKGERLSVIMAERQGMFPEMVVALISAGEESGRLEDILRDIATYLERELELRNMVSRETFYAKILIAAVLLLPLATKTIIAYLMVSALAAAWVFIKGLALYAVLGGIPILCVWFVFVRLRSSQTGRVSLDTMKLSVPITGTIVESLCLARFGRSMSTLFAAGVALPEAVNLAADIAGNRAIAEPMKRAVTHLQQGKTLSEGLLGTRLVGTLLYRLLQTGEQTGNVDDMMSKAADHYEDEAATKVRRLAVTIVPVVTILTGIVVCVIALRFFVPYYEEMLK